MGTRADYYVGRGESAEWLGSVAWDGMDLEPGIANATTEEAYRSEVALLAKREDFTSPDMGWPWPWEDSSTTDYAYAFDGGHVWASCFGEEWWDATAPAPEERGPKTAVFPDMTDRQNLTFGRRSGLIIIG